MILAKEKFDKNINNNGHKVIVKHSDKKVHCNCYEKDNKNKCYKCFNTGWKYDSYITKTRRSKKGAGSLTGDGLEKKEAFNLYANSYKYYFKTDDIVTVEDFIIEFNQNDLKLFYVRNYDLKTGQKGIDVYNEVYANRVILDKDILETSFLDIIEQSS